MISNYSLEDLRRNSPAAFTPLASPAMSDVYSHVTTLNVIDALQQDGWLLESSRQKRSRRPDTVESNLHQVTLVHPELPTHREGRAQMLIGNSGNGSSALRLMGGFLRMACLNQNYAGVKVVGGIFYHRGSSLEDRVVAGARELRSNFGRVIEAYDRWAAIELSPDQQSAFALAALPLRWPTAEVTANPSELLRLRRDADDSSSLWHTYNRTQEALIRGGFLAEFQERDEAGQVSGHTLRRVRKVTGLTASERINLGLWDLAQAFTPGPIEVDAVAV